MVTQTGNDIYLAYLAGYWKLGSSDLQALSASLRYFSLGEIVLTDNQGNAQNSITPYEMAFDVGYSRKLSDKFSMGVVFRYIYSDLGFHYDESSVSDRVHRPSLPIYRDTTRLIPS